MTLLVSDQIRPYQMAPLRYCLAERMPTKTVSNDAWLAVETLILPQFVRNRTGGYMPREMTTFFRERIFAALELTTPPQKSRRIYISRAKATLRRVLNDDEVVACLQKHGFEVCIAEDLSFDEQVRIFHEAEVVAGPHGSGFTNLLFCEPPVKVVEFQCDPPTDLSYIRIARALNLEHHFLPSDQATKDDDMRVDVAALDQKLHEIL